MSSVRIKRGTRAQIASAAAANGLKQGELYHVTDENRVDVGTGTDASSALATKSEVDGKEPTISAGTSAQYWRGDKSWRDFATDVRTTVLTGLSTATNAVITATDTVLTMAGKLQKQISDHFAAASGAHAATAISNTPAGGIAATNVQAAIDELDTEKLPKSGGTMTGGLTLPANGLVVGSNQIVASDGNVGLGISSPRAPLHSFNASNYGNPDTTGTGVTGVSARIQSGTVNMDFGVYSSGNLWIQGRLNTDNATTFQLVLNPVGGPVLVGPGGFGYATGIGAGGAVTQPTSKSTGVTLNKPGGMVTTHAESLGAGATANFALNSSSIASTDVVVVCISYLSGAGLNYRVSATTGLAGQAVISLQNTSGVARAEAIEIHFAVIKKANA